MKEASFITRPLSVWLDLVRALAALAVVIGHAKQIHVYTGPFPSSMFFQKNAVVVFFVLSGMVIAASVDRDRKSLGHFAIARISRIMPVALGAIAVSLAVAALDVRLQGDPLFVEDLRWADPRELLRALLFLSESYTTGFPPNAPYWSLSYEVWFYALFAAATYLSGPMRAIWLAGLAAIAGPNILLLLPIWLVGVALVRTPLAARVPTSLAGGFIVLAIAALFVAPLFATDAFRLLRPLVPWRMGSSLYVLTDFLLALALATGFAGLRTLSNRGLVIPARAEPAIRWGANMSFSLYLLHWPLLKLVHMAGLTAGNNPFGFAAIVAGIVAISGAFATVTEHKRYVVRAWIERALRQRPAATSAA
ncbi:MAG: Acyltransferase family protein [Novosphingobium sp.]|nr:Acyltransferase family protein [Novosphingobium sp.]